MQLIDENGRLDEDPCESFLHESGAIEWNKLRGDFNHGTAIERQKHAAEPSVQNVVQRNGRIIGATTDDERGVDGGGVFFFFFIRKLLEYGGARFGRVGRSRTRRRRPNV